MAKIIFSDEAFEQIMQKLTEVEALLKVRQSVEDIFLDNQEFLQVMNISKRLAQEWRNENLIAFSQIKNKIYYRMSDILKLLNGNRVEAK